LTHTFLPTNGKQFDGQTGIFVHPLGNRRFDWKATPCNGISCLAFITRSCKDWLARIEQAGKYHPRKDRWDIAIGQDGSWKSRAPQGRGIADRRFSCRSGPHTRWVPSNEIHSEDMAPPSIGRRSPVTAHCGFIGFC
jgi:hypothetical protein